MMMVMSRIHPGIRFRDSTHHFSSALMAAIVSWRISSLVVVVPSTTPPALSKVPVPFAVKRPARLCRVPPARFACAPTSLRLMAAKLSCDSSPPHCLHGFAAPCRAADRDGDGEYVRDNGVGEIHVIVGPMFAGKTTALLRRIRKEADAGRRVSLVKSDKDNRYAVSAVISHDGVQMPCVAVPSLATFREHVGEEEYRQIEVIGIDEAQFFDDLVQFCRSAADLDNKTVIVAGLDGDFLRRRFGAVLDLIPSADSVTKLHARCELCNQLAPFTFRKTVDVATEVIGGADVYMPVCRHHFVSGQNAVETARSVMQVHKESRRGGVQAPPLQPSNSRAS